jgi:hypothetical protein
LLVTRCQLEKRAPRLVTSLRRSPPFVPSIARPFPRQGTEPLAEESRGFVAPTLGFTTQAPASPAPRLEPDDRHIQARRPPFAMWAPKEQAPTSPYGIWEHFGPDVPRRSRVTMRFPRKRFAEAGPERLTIANQFPVDEFRGEDGHALADACSPSPPATAGRGRRNIQGNLSWSSPASSFHPSLRLSVRHAFPARFPRTRSLSLRLTELAVGMVEQRFAKLSEDPKRHDTSGTRTQLSKCGRRAATARNEGRNRRAKASTVGPDTALWMCGVGRS